MTFRKEKLVAGNIYYDRHLVSRITFIPETHILAAEITHLPPGSSDGVLWFHTDPGPAAIEWRCERSGAGCQRAVCSLPE